MAVDNLTSLKEMINNVITTNGTKKITGKTLNSVLIQMCGILSSMGGSGSGDEVFYQMKYQGFNMDLLNSESTPLTDENGNLDLFSYSDEDLAHNIEIREKVLQDISEGKRPKFTIDCGPALPILLNGIMGQTDEETGEQIPMFPEDVIIRSDAKLGLIYSESANMLGGLFVILPVLITEQGRIVIGASALGSLPTSI